MTRCDYEGCSLGGDETEGGKAAKGRPNYGRNYEGCSSQWTRDVYDYTYDYESDWFDRFDDAEGSMRNAFSSLFGNRRGRRRSIEDRPPRALRQGVHTEDILKEAGFLEIVDKVEELTKKIEALTKKA